jgi:hypothetical protein
MNQVPIQKPNRRAGHRESCGHYQQKHAHGAAEMPPPWGIPLVRTEDHHRQRSRTQACIVFSPTHRIEQGADDHVDASHLQFGCFARRGIGLEVGMQ